MATYTAGQLEGAGTPIEALTEEITYTFTITSTGDNSSYFTIETVKDGRGVYSSTSPTNANGEYTAFDGIDGNTLITSLYISSVVIPKTGGSYSFTPKASITAGSSYLRGTGGITLSISDGTYVFATKAELQTAVNLWISDNTAALATYGEINTWNVSAITDMDDLFKNKTTFNSNISNWDVSNVTSMRNVFEGATAFNQPIGDWNMSSVNATWSMFRNATSFNQPINNWDMSSVQGMLSMFANADSFQQPLNLWEVNALQNNISQGFMGVTGDADAIIYTGYDALLIGWAANASIPTGITISFGDSTFTSTALAARNILVNDKSWTITDGGQV